ncbi:MAG: putative internalin [Myxococcales bacterium]|nr:putative internalin [Myxococcales bacterium]
MTPNPVSVGNVIVGATGSATGTLDDNNNDHVDLALTTCTGTGTGTFSLSPMTNINLSSPKPITVMYTPATNGPRQCSVDVYFNGTTTKIGTFNVRGTGQNPPTISVTGTTAFGNVRFNDAAPVHTSTQSFTVTNTGDVDLQITNVAIGGTDASDFSITTGGTTATILPGNTGTWVVTFDPTAAGARSGTLTFSSNDPATPTTTLALSGTGTTAIIGVNNLNYAIVNTGSSSSLDVTVQNNGAGTKGNLGVTTAAISGGAGWFTFSACGGGSSCTFAPALAIATSTVVGITCSPPTGAVPNAMQTATVLFTSDTDDASATPDNLSTLTCTAGNSALATTTPMVSFTGQLVGTTSTVQSVTVTNTGNVGATLYFRLTGTNAGQFRASTASACGTSAANQCAIAANGGSVAFDVTFVPTAEGDISAGLDLASTGAFPQLTLAGRGIDRHIMTPAAVMFADTFRNPGDLATVASVTVNNIGEYPLHVSSIAVAGGPIWTLADPPDPFDVPGHGSHDVMIRFTPPAAGKMPDGALAVTSDDRTTAMSNVTLRGNGKDRRVSMGPMEIELGDTGAGVPTRLSDVNIAQLLSVSNLDDTNTFQIRQIVIEGDSVFETRDLNNNTVSNVGLPPVTTTQFDIVFTPPAVGDFHATAKLYLDQDPEAQTSVPVHGRALFVDAHGSGGCSTSNGANGGMTIFVGVLLLGWKRRRGAAVVAVLLSSAATRAEPTRNIDLTVFDPTPTTSGSSLQLQTADVGANGEYAATAFASYASGPLVLGTVASDAGVVRNRTMMSIGGAYAFLDRFEAGARMPFYVQSGDAIPMNAFGISPASGTARGDLTLHAKARLVRTRTASLGLGLALELPTATDSQFAGPAKPSARVLGLLSLMPSHRMTVNVNLGGVIRSRAEFANIEQRSGFAGGLGVSYRVGAPLFLTLEVFGEIVPSGYHAAPQDGSTMGATSALKTIEGLAGARYSVSRRLSVSLGVGRGLTSSVGTPDLRGVLMMSWTPAAPPLPVARPLAVAAVPGRADGIKTDPNTSDRDFDRIPDAVDKCPDEPEDFDDFEDTDGCPDLDNDKDGIADAKDKCPNAAEDKDGFEDEDGCPDLDNDKDGILDADDKCINQPETINGIKDDDGCPDAGDSLVISSPDRLDLLEPVRFTGFAIDNKSVNVLGQLAATLRARADIVRIRITTHVQPTNQPDRDQGVTDRRAEAVRAWLVKWGIAASRLEIRGFGGTKPLVAPREKGSAQINNRLELIVLERK